MVKSRLQFWVETNNIIPENQRGFRKGHSCLDNLTILKLKIDEAFLEKKEVLAAFLDVQGAFDNVQIDILLSILASIGCPLRLIQCRKFLAWERLIFTETCDKEPRKTFKGVHQGGVLSPLLYLIYVASITVNLQKNVIVSQFADDITIYIKTSSSSLKRAKSSIEKAIEKLKNNLINLGLELTPNKTVFIHFNKKTILPGETVIKIGDHLIKSSESKNRYVFLASH